jgi:hypothetical protein
MIQAIMLVCSLAIPREHCVDNTADYYTQMLGDWKNPYACQFEAQAKLADDVNKGLVTIDPDEAVRGRALHSIGQKQHRLMRESNEFLERNRRPGIKLGFALIERLCVGGAFYINTVLHFRAETASVPARRLW